MATSEETKKTSSAETADISTDFELIHSWSTPRSLSTSLMYSFAQRDDTEVLDEVLYAHYLHVSGAYRPYKEELLATVEIDANKVFSNIIMRPCNKKYRYCKHIANQRTKYLTSEMMKTGKHFILIRDPVKSLPSYDNVLPQEAVKDEFCISELFSVYVELRRNRCFPVIVNATDIQKNPEATLRSLCASLNIPFQATMLRWPAGAIKEDGMWSPWWYKTIHNSTGFGPPQLCPKKAFPLELYDLLEECQPFYQALKRHALVPDECTVQADSLIPLKENAKILVWVGGEFLPRELAKVSVFDSIVQGGDGVWEGLRVYNGKIFKLDEHLDRLLDSAKALAFASIPTTDEIQQAIFGTLIINGMLDGAHVRLTLTRGKKVTSGMSPIFNKYGYTLIVLAEWKPPVFNDRDGICLVTASTRRNSPSHLDSKIHHNNLLNNILAKVEGNLAGADDAIMLDANGYVSETNSMNIFMVKKGVIFTRTADSCLPGITRKTVAELAKDNGYTVVERHISLSEFHTADEVWTTGTMGELTPVIKIDGRLIGDGKVGPITKRIQGHYAELTESLGVPIPVHS